MKRSLWTIPPALILTLLAFNQMTAQAVPSGLTMSLPKVGCDLGALSRSKGEFLKLSARRRAAQSTAESDELRRASTDYIIKTEACYQALYSGSAASRIDDGGVWFSPDGSQPFVTKGTKWGAGSPFTGGSNVPGPRIAGGTVTYSYMANGISNAAEGSDANVAISSLPTFSACFLTDISNALAAWSAVANIQFVQVADNGLAFNAAGATGDIRIGAHTFDGPSAVLAHGYYPPPNGTSASGDVHFDRQENWGCSPGSGVIDIGIVATHEFGHAIGLDHEPTITAIMNPFYNASVAVPQADDITAASSIYGTPPVVATSKAGDFDGDGKSDITTYRPATGTWYVLKSTTNYASYTGYQWGVSSDVTVAADYDGDSKADIAIYRPATGLWYILLSSTGYSSYISYQWGVSTDVPTPADYDGDGKADVAVYRPATGIWYVLKSTTNSTNYVSYQWGVSSDVPVPGDYDGDHKADIAVYRPATGVWYILLSTTNSASYISYQWGVSTDTPVAADYDGDRKADVAVYRPATGVWYILLSTTNSTGYTSYQWGVSTDTPVPADYDGDGKTDVAVFRPATGFWYPIFSSGGSASYQWGVSSDVPINKRP
jgi:Matrixin